MKNILTIGGGNGNSSILKLLFENENFGEINVSSIVSMSDDGRTTGVLMKQMQEGLGIHMPPPGDLRRCLFALSNSEYRKNFEELFETVINFDGNISNFSIKKILEKLNVSTDFINIFSEINDNKLNLDFPIKGHKFGNLLMANIYYNFSQNYSKMMNFIHKLLEVRGKIIPVTNDRAFIQAKLENGKIVKTQDKISNVANYNSAIEKIELMENSKNAKLNNIIEKILKKVDYIIIGPGDLYTSILSNFIIENFSEIIKKSNAKIIYILNSNNKTGETTDYQPINFIEKILEKTGKIDYLFGNSVIPEQTQEEKNNFKKDKSVKGGEYLILDKTQKQIILEKYPKTNIITGKYINDHELYKFNKNLIEDIYKVILEK